MSRGHRDVEMGVVHFLEQRTVIVFNVVKYEVHCGRIMPLLWVLQEDE